VICNHVAPIDGFAVFDGGVCFNFALPRGLPCRPALLFAVVTAKAKSAIADFGWWAVGLTLDTAGPAFHR
jgi:hypothetical protein